MPEDSKTRRTAPSILQVVPALDAGGVERTAVDVAIAAAKAGYRSYIASRGGRLGIEAEAAGVHLLMLPPQTKGPLRIALNARLLSSYIRELGIGLVHGRSRAPAWSAYFAARGAHAHFVTTYAGIHRENFPGKRLYNSIMARGEAVIANSQYTADHILKTYRIPEARVRVIPRGIDLARFDPRAADPARVSALRQAWGAGAQDRIVLLPARMTRWKGQSVMVEAARLLRERGARDLVFVMAGETAGHETYLAEVWAAAHEAGVAERLRVIGHVPDMATAYTAADAIAAPSTEPEAFGRVPVEAQAMGKPVIATNIGAPRETVRAGETGFLVPPGDARALADAILAALSLDPRAKGQMAAAQLAQVRQRYSLEAMCAATLKVYQQVLRG